MTTGACIDFVSIFGIITTSAINIVVNLTIKVHISELYYVWAICSMCSAISIIYHLKKETILGSLVDIVFHSIRQTYTFIFVILIEYLIFALIGISLFGGCINSQTSFIYSERVGDSLNSNYEYLNWNDFLNSLVFLFALTMNNQMIMLINMSTVSGGEFRDYRTSFFLVFVILNNMILFNIFIGQVIGISIEYFKALKNEKPILDQVYDNFSETDQEDSGIFDKMPIINVNKV